MSGSPEKDPSARPFFRDEVFSGLKRRRCRSLSKAEKIVTEEEKIRRAQPDKPFHRPQDSLFSWRSEFHNFEGVVNWAFLLLTIGGLRLGLENLNKYGILVDPTKWIFYLLGCTKNESNMFPTCFMLLFSNIAVLTAFIIEKLISKNLISKHVCRTLHGLNFVAILLFPIYVINTKYEYIGPGMEGVFCFVSLSHIVLFMKIYSYMCTMEWLREDLLRKKSNKKLKRERSVQHYWSGNSPSQLNSLLANLKIEKSPSTILENENSSSEDKPVSNSTKDDFVRVKNLLSSPMVSTSTLHLEVMPKLLEYPDNLTVGNIYYFWLAPTLCYELNFPRSSRTRKLFLFRRCIEVIIGINLILALIQQWIIPGVVNSLIPFSEMNLSLATERLLKLAIPNHLIWLTMFYLLFHSYLNTIGELLHFADRSFYSDWWNSKNIMDFWKKWNMPVHKWCVRHLFKPLINEMGFTRFQSMVAVFLVSAIFHEYMVSVPLRMFKAYAFCAMAVQIPLLYISNYVLLRFGPRAGNLIVWLSLILGQPLAVLMYYHDFVVEHYGKELIQTFGKLK